LGFTGDLEVLARERESERALLEQRATAVVSNGLRFLHVPPGSF
jgi:hypothetical protein